MGDDNILVQDPGAVPLAETPWTAGYSGLPGWKIESEIPEEDETVHASYRDAEGLHNPGDAEYAPYRMSQFIEAITADFHRQDVKQHCQLFRILKQARI